MKMIDLTGTELPLGDDVVQMPDSLITQLCMGDPAFARATFATLGRESRHNITALRMAAEILQSLHYGRMPRSRPLMKAVRHRHEGLALDLGDSSGFNQTLLATLGVDVDSSENPRAALEDLVSAYVGGFVVCLDSVVEFSQLSGEERDFEVIPFPAFRLSFDPIDY